MQESIVRFSALTKTRKYVTGRAIKIAKSISFAIRYSLRWQLDILDLSYPSWTQALDFSHAGQRQFPDLDYGDSDEDSEPEESAETALLHPLHNSLLVWRFQHSWMDLPASTHGTTSEAVVEKDSGLSGMDAGKGIANLLQTWMQRALISNKDSSEWFKKPTNTLSKLMVLSSAGQHTDFKSVVQACCSVDWCNSICSWYYSDGELKLFSQSQIQYTRKCCAWTIEGYQCLIMDMLWA